MNGARVGVAKAERTVSAHRHHLESHRSQRIGRLSMAVAADVDSGVGTVV